VKTKDGSALRYTVVGKEGVAKNEEKLFTGDKLIVASQDGKTKKTYNIATEPMAIKGRLSLEKKEITFNTNTDLTLYFTAGKEHPMLQLKFISQRYNNNRR
jgi:hypothetical protein